MEGDEGLTHELSECSTVGFYAVCPPASASCIDRALYFCLNLILLLASVLVLFSALTFTYLAIRDSPALATGCKGCRWLLDKARSRTTRGQRVHHRSSRNARPGRGGVHPEDGEDEERQALMS